MLGVLALGVLSRKQPQELARFVGNLRAVGPWVLAPATIAVVGLGVWMVLNNSAWSFGQTWVVLGLCLFATAFVIGAAYQSQAAIKAGRAADRGDHPEALRQLARWSLGYWLIVALLVVATWDMVIKPGQ